MKTIRMALTHCWTDEPLDTRLGQLACYLGAVAIVPTSVVALVKHPGGRADMFLGLALACLVAVLLVMLGTLCRRSQGVRDKTSLRSRWPEFASYAACVGFLVVGIRWFADLGLTPVQITIGLLLTCSLSLAVLALGMMTTVVRSHGG